jgi:hypothetical protein
MREIETTREQIWLIALTALLVLILVGGVIAIVTLWADIDALDRQVAALAGGQIGAANAEAGGEWGTDGVGWGVQQPTAQPGGPTGRILGTRTLSNTFQITVAVRFAGPGHLLYEPPILVSASASGSGGNQVTYYPTQASLKQAHLDFLSLVAGGEATSALVFRPVPPPGGGLTLVFNPNHQPGDLVAPRWEMSVRANGQIDK